MWLLFAPISLNIDSRKNKYLINWGGLGNLTLIPDKEEWFFNFKIGFWKKKIFLSSLIERQRRKDEKESEPGKKKKKTKISFFKTRRKIRRFVTSFNVRVCRINLDTDDYYWNALLIPVVQLVNKGNLHRIVINFKNKNDVLLIIENRLIKVLYSILR